MLSLSRSLITCTRESDVLPTDCSFFDYCFLLNDKYCNSDNEHYDGHDCSFFLCRNSKLESILTTVLAGNRP